jgi:hypothetical protein
MIPDIEKFLPVSIFKLADTIPQKFKVDSEINSGHHYLPIYQILMISDNAEFCGILAAILKMATGRNFSMSGINSEHHNLPT